MDARLIAAAVMLALALAGPLQPLAGAQQSRPMSSGQARPDVSEATEDFEEDVEPPVDFYDFGAVVMTVVGFPLKAVVCALGTVAGATLFVITFGSADRASASVVREGCSHNWVVSGRDLRPDTPPAHAIEWDMQEAAGRR